ncbi:MAG: DNA internalization-related competence protein ComEC/Rec2 [Actinobacteria bacterium]|nr:DNA internalization-related competence protein ComEC/Rec2 [Actinomycetota bacterium]
MTSVQNKPALKLFILLIAGIILGRCFIIPPLFLFSILILSTIFVFITFAKQFRRLFALCVILAFVVAGALLLQARVSSFPRNHIRQYVDLPVPVAIEGTIDSPVDVREKAIKFVVNVDSIWVDYMPRLACGKALITLYDLHASLKYGDHIVAKGRLASPSGERNPGEFNYRKYLAAKNIYAVMSVSSGRRFCLISRGNGVWFLQQLVYPVRSFIIRFVDKSLNGQSAALLKGLLVGARGDIDPNLKQSFANVGVIHVLAVSGLHVGFILAGLLYLFRLLRIREPFRTLFVILCLVYYAYLTGLHAPVVRATIMASILLVGNLLQRPNDALNSIAAAGLILLVLNPLDLFQPGFQLSFAAVIGIILIYKNLHAAFLKYFTKWQERENLFRSSLVSLFFVSLAAQLATLPLTAYYFGRIPIISLLANLLIVPLVGLIVALGFISIALGAVWVPLGFIYANTNGLLLSILIWLVKTAEKFRFSYVTISRPSPWLTIFYLLALILFLAWRNVKSRKVALLAILFFANLLVWHRVKSNTHVLKAVFFDVGQGDSALFQFPDGKTLLVDAGERSDKRDYGEQVIAPYLRREGIHKITNIIVTHAHADHIGGVPYLIQHFKVGRIIESRVDDDLYLSYLVDSLAAVRNDLIIRAAAGDTIGGYEKALLLILHPTPPFVAGAEKYPQTLNDASVVVKLIYGRISFLLTGDAERPSEMAMRRFGSLLKSDILKVGHHGSSTSSSNSFRHRVRPNFAVVSVGRYNHFGLPSKRILRFFRNEGAVVIRTDESGAAVFETDGSKIKRIR